MQLTHVISIVRFIFFTPYQENYNNLFLKKYINLTELLLIFIFFKIFNECVSITILLNIHIISIKFI